MSQQLTFEDWTSERTVQWIGTNHGSDELPFQAWQKVKEAFAPEVVSRAIEESGRGVASLVDPFGGSGTSALASQFAGVIPTTIEVNPYLADLTEAKLARYDLASLQADIARVVKLKPGEAELAGFSNWLPPTFVEPGVNGRWLFSTELAGFLGQILQAVEATENEKNRRLLRVLVGGTLVGLSNARVSGKGRRYRSSWRSRESSARDAGVAIRKSLYGALADIGKFGIRPTMEYTLLRGDSRSQLDHVREIDLAVFSPPYPNSFDYTDVYNIELWVLGYLANMAENRTLRESTLASHVQVKRDFASAPVGSDLLTSTIASLNAVQETLWSRHIPDMVGAYFADMERILEGLALALNDRAEVWMVVGDSRYAGVDVPVATILGELGAKGDLELLKVEPFRSMRASPQQGGRRELAESLVVLRRKNRTG